MSTELSVLAEIDALLLRLETAERNGLLDGRLASDMTDRPSPARVPDAIDRELGRPSRVTLVGDIRTEMRAFRSDLVNGLIAIDTAQRVLKLVDKLVMLAL